MKKSVLAVLAGLVVTIALSIGLDVIMYSTGVFPASGAEMTESNWSMATAYRIVAAIVGTWVTARLAPARPMKHALITGGIGMAIATLGAVLAWNKGPEFGPHWYMLALIITALPCAWIGAKFHAAAAR